MNNIKRVVAVYGRTFNNNINDSNFFQESYPWLKGEIVLYIGGIQDMPGHGVFVRNDGKTYYGYHINDFIPMKTIDDEQCDDFKSFFHMVKDQNDNKFYFCMKEEGIKKYKNNAGSL